MVSSAAEGTTTAREGTAGPPVPHWALQGHRAGLAAPLLCGACQSLDAAGFGFSWCWMLMLWVQHLKIREAPQDKSYSICDLASSEKLHFCISFNVLLHLCLPSRGGTSNAFAPSTSFLFFFFFPPFLVYNLEIYLKIHFALWKFWNPDLFQL